MEKYGIARQAKGDKVIWCMCIACWVTKATNTCSEYVILTVFSWQQWLHKCTSLLCYTYIVLFCCLGVVKKNTILEVYTAFAEVLVLFQAA